MRRSQPAHERLQRFIDENGLKAVDCAKALDVSAAAVSTWLSGAVVPKQVHRLALERWTGSEIASDDWETDEERAAKKIQPAKKTGTER